MIIKLFPFLTDETIEASVKGDVITINGEVIDLSGIPTGYRLPGSAVGNDFFVATEYIERVDGVLNFTLRLPVHSDSPEEFRNAPSPIIIDTQNGEIPFPNTSPSVPEVIEPTPLPKEIENDRPESA